MKTYNLPKIILTGATGWIGRSILHQLQIYLSPKQFLENVIPLSNNQKILNSSGFSGKPYSFYTYPLDKSINHSCSQKPSILIHTAFLTKDRISQFGKENYLSLNKKITFQALEITKRYNVQKVILISSGSARKYDTHNYLEYDLLSKADDPYAFLKRSEEISFSSLDVDCYIFRVFALSGLFARSPNSFALLSFLTSALNGQRIIIKSRKKCIRGYVSSSQLALVIFKILSSQRHINSLMVNALTDETDLLSMAYCISDMFNLEPPSFEINNLLEKDIYTANKEPFCKLLQDHNIKPMVLKKQILETANYFKNYLNNS